MHILDAAFHPMRSVGRVCSVAPHWFFTLLAVAFTTWFVAVVFDILPAPKHHSVWKFGAYAVLSVLLAITSWIAKFHQHKFEYTDEILEVMHLQKLAEIQRALVRRLTADEARSMMTEHNNCEERESTTAFDDWLTDNASAQDELWFYYTGRDREDPGGEMGFAIVRNEQVIGFYNWVELN